MLRYHSYNIVFQEVPGELTLAINISNCPNGCKGCHSPHLQENSGEELSENALCMMLTTYKSAITCVCFMGGDAEPDNVEKLALYVQKITEGTVKTAWYSGKSSFPKNCSTDSFNYIKLGSYIPEMGGLNQPTTNQRFYRVQNGLLVDETKQFWKKERI